MTSAQYKGLFPVTYPDHVDAATGRTLTVVPGGIYDIRVAPGRNPGLSPVPGDGRWSRRVHRRRPRSRQKRTRSRNRPTILPPPAMLPKTLPSSLNRPLPGSRTTARPKPPRTPRRARPLPLKARSRHANRRTSPLHPPYGPSSASPGNCSAGTAVGPTNTIPVDKGSYSPEDMPKFLPDEALRGVMGGLFNDIIGACGRLVQLRRPELPRHARVHVFDNLFGDLSIHRVERGPRDHP